MKSIQLFKSKFKVLFSVPKHITNTSLQTSFSPSFPPPPSHYCFLKIDISHAAPLQAIPAHVPAPLQSHASSVPHPYRHLTSCRTLADLQPRLNVIRAAPLHIQQLDRLGGPCRTLAFEPPSRHQVLRAAPLQVGTWGFFFYLAPHPCNRAEKRGGHGPTKPFGGPHGDASVCVRGQISWSKAESQ